MPVADSGYASQHEINVRNRLRLLADIKEGRGFSSHSIQTVRRSVGSGVRIGPLKRGALNGYHLGLPAKERRYLLIRDLQSSGYTTTVKRLIALKTVNKNHATNKKIVDSDLAWIRKFWKSHSKGQPFVITRAYNKKYGH